MRLYTCPSHVSAFVSPTRSSIGVYIEHARAWRAKYGVELYEAPSGDKPPRRQLAQAQAQRLARDLVCCLAARLVRVRRGRPADLFSHAMTRSMPNVWRRREIRLALIRSPHQFTDPAQCMVQGQCMADQFFTKSL